MTEELIRAHGNWLPAWTHNNELERVA
jgi:hypothetical protein